MRVIPTLVLLGFAVAVPAAASNPGEPMDCADWVFPQPGLSCATFIPPRCEDLPDNELCNLDFRGLVSDNLGRFYYLRTAMDVGAPCDGNFEDRVELVRFDNTSTETVIAHIQDRCWFEDPTCYDQMRPAIDGSFRPKSLRFDPVAGRMFIKVQSTDGPTDPITPCTPYSDETWVLAVEGFASLFDIATSFDLANGTLSFTVPVMPEGFQGADWFNTYYGDLSTVGDWSRAQPLQCGYPMTMPTTGDHLTVNDPLPDPAPGTGRYYITSVNYQGQIRYGRKATGGVLSGRDPGVLPPCN